MTRDEVATIVTAQIADQWERPNLHKVDLRRSIVEPIEMNFIDARDEPVMAWLVLREDPDGGPGYGVAYEPSAGQFGLVQFADGYAPFFIGLYGRFFDALDAM